MARFSFTVTNPNTNNIALVECHGRVNWAISIIKPDEDGTPNKKKTNVLARAKKGSGKSAIFWANATLRGLNPDLRSTKELEKEHGWYKLDIDSFLSKQELDDVMDNNMTCF